MATRNAKTALPRTSAHARLIVIGASAGGIEAVRIVLARLPEDFAAAVLVVIHISSDSPNMLPHILQRVTRLRISPLPKDSERIKAGEVYLAPPDNHLLVNDGELRLSKGPRENRHRPAIDPLFRSAAAARGVNVIGVILTGNMGDGSAGLLAIKECGGITIVQTPDDAAFPDMPRNALERAKPDYIVPVAQMGALLTRLVAEPPPKPRKEIPVRFKEESAISEMNLTLNQMSKLGKPSQFACPECHGVLWEITEPGNVRFRCRVGHAYSLESLGQSMDGPAEEAMWTAVRALEEKISVLERLAFDARKRHRYSSAQHFEERARELIPAVNTLSGLLVKTSHQKMPKGRQAKPPGHVGTG